MKIKCQGCDAEYRIDAGKIPATGATATCKRCGNKISIDPPAVDSSSDQVTVRPSGPPVPPSEGVIREDELAKFVGKNAEKYLRKFRKFRSNDGEGFALTWHWLAFFVTFWWMLYRKLYLWALLAFGLMLFPILSFLPMLAFGATANYIYYKHAKKRIAQAKYGRPSEYSPQVLPLMGGTNSIVLFFAAIPALIVFIGILAAIAIPNFMAFKEKALEASLVADLKSAAIAQEEFYDDNDRYCTSVQDLVDGYGLELAQGNEIKILKADKAEYEMMAFRRDSDKTHFIRGGSTRGSEPGRLKGNGRYELLER